MSNRTAEARDEIKGYIGRKVTAELDGVLFDSEGGSFSFRFADPDELRSELADDYEDYLAEWDFDQTVPVAAVSAATSPDYEFAWLFLDWSESENAPRVLVTTTDRWDVDDAYAVASLGALGLKLA
jgi:hypothetical protein